MKKLILVLSILSSLTFYIKISIEREFVVKGKEIDDNWNEIVKLQDSRNSILKSNMGEVDSLEYWITKREQFKILNNDSLDISFIEVESRFPIANKNQLVKNSLELINKDLNTRVNSYNELVKDYNIFFIKFPNHILARNKYLKKKRFDVVYGNYIFC
ncbi:hypothetical protein MCERE19_02021 [Spirosomataceae bacterium]|jgi:hypothetical protein